MKGVYLAALLFICGVSARAQYQVPPPPDTIITALYECISGPAGTPVQEARLRNLFDPSAKMIPVGVRKDGSVRADYFTVEDYLGKIKEFKAANGFIEQETARRIEQFGSLCSVWSTYRATITVPGQPESIITGINSIQLWHDGTRWKVMNISWQAANENLPIPKKYTRSPKKEK